VVNPTLTHSNLEPGDPDEELESEGCLSFPGERFALKRGESALIEGVDLDQNPVRIEAVGWFARIFQHEFDHLNGIVYVDKLPFESRQEAFELMQELGWNKPGVTWLPGTDNLED
jgi:peptide deformylase